MTKNDKTEPVRTSDWLKQYWLDNLPFLQRWVIRAAMLALVGFGFTAGYLLRSLL
jgi:hypothetical protein